MDDTEGRRWWHKETDSGHRGAIAAGQGRARNGGPIEGEGVQLAAAQPSAQPNLEPKPKPKAGSCRRRAILSVGPCAPGPAVDCHDKHGTPR